MTPPRLGRAGACQRRGGRGCAEEGQRGGGGRAGAGSVRISNYILGNGGTSPFTLRVPAAGTTTRVLRGGDGMLSNCDRPPTSSIDLPVSAQ